VTAAQATGRGQNFRVSQLLDIVPDVPPTTVDFNGAYAHILPWYQIDSPPPTPLTPTTRQNINRITTDVANSPNLNVLTAAFRLANHNYYINNIAACGDTSTGAIATANAVILNPLIAALLDKFPALKTDLVFGPIIQFLMSTFGIGVVQAQTQARIASLY
jgi:hypothetical protein